MIVFVFFVRAVAVDGISMEPTLQGGDRLLVQSIGYTPQRGDVVVIDGYINYGKPLVKRVIGLGGDVVDIDAATVRSRSTVRCWTSPISTIRPPSTGT